MIVIGVPDVRGLRKAIEKMVKAGIAHYEWNEPDNDFGLTAVATEAISGEKREALKNYRLWKSYCPAVSERTSASKAEGAGENPAGTANASVAQLVQSSDL